MEQGQFRMIKWYYHLIGRIDWNECRGLNYQSIIEVMEDNLAGLYNVRLSPSFSSL